MSGKKSLQRNGSSPEINIALLGSLGVGKSALTVKYITKRFIMEYDPDIEDTYTKHEVWNNRDITIQVMDTCDKENSDPQRYLRWADAFIVVYSITSQASFEKAKEYLEIVNQHKKNFSKENMPVALLGNKIDLERYRQVSKAEGTKLATDYMCLFYEATAAEEYEYVEEVFHGVILYLLQYKNCYLPHLFISEEKQALGQVPARPKSPKGTSERKEDKDTKGIPKKNTSSFKIFNKSFKIFN